MFSLWLHKIVYFCAMWLKGLFWWVNRKMVGSLWGLLVGVGFWLGRFWVVGLVREGCN